MRSRLWKKGLFLPHFKDFFPKRRKASKAGAIPSLAAKKPLPKKEAAQKINLGIPR